MSAPVTVPVTVRERLEKKIDGRKAYIAKLKLSLERVEFLLDSLPAQILDSPVDEVRSFLNEADL